MLTNEIRVLLSWLRYFYQQAKSCQHCHRNELPPILPPHPWSLRLFHQSLFSFLHGSLIRCYDRKESACLSWTVLNGLSKLKATSRALRSTLGTPFRHRRHLSFGLTNIRIKSLCVHKPGNFSKAAFLSCSPSVAVWLLYFRVQLW